MSAELRCISHSVAGFAVSCRHPELRWEVEQYLNAGVLAYEDFPDYRHIEVQPLSYPVPAGRLNQVLIAARLAAYVREPVLEAVLHYVARLEDIPQAVFFHKLLIIVEKAGFAGRSVTVQRMVQRLGGQHHILN